MRRGTEGGVRHHGGSMDTEPILQGFLKGEQLDPMAPMLGIFFTDMKKHTQIPK